MSSQQKIIVLAVFTAGVFYYLNQKEPKKERTRKSRFPTQEEIDAAKASRKYKESQREEDEERDTMSFSAKSFRSSKKEKTSIEVEEKKEDEPLSLSMKIQLKLEKIDLIDDPEKRERRLIAYYKEIIKDMPEAMLDGTLGLSIFNKLLETEDRRVYDAYKILIKNQTLTGYEEGGCLKVRVDHIRTSKKIHSKEVLAECVPGYVVEPEVKTLKVSKENREKIEEGVFEDSIEVGENLEEELPIERQDEEGDFYEQEDEGLGEEGYSEELEDFSGGEALGGEEEEEEEELD